MKNLTAKIQTAQAADWQDLMTGFCDDAVAEQEKLEALAALSRLPVSADMLAACAQWLLDHAVPLDIPGAEDAIDVCGTGGDKAKDGIKTFNISTAAALVLAAAGQPVIKHGNRAVSSLSGSSDVLQALGVPVAETAAAAREIFARHGICFIAAPAFHPALKAIGPVRKKFGRPTFFNLLGPLCNPARVKKQVIGVYDPAFLRPVALAAQSLGKQNVLTVHGMDGLDEFSLSGKSLYCRLQKDTVTEGGITPEDAGFIQTNAALLAGGTPAENAETIRRVFSGSGGPACDIVCLNAGAALWVAGRAETIAAGALTAAETIATGNALQKLDALQRESAA